MEDERVIGQAVCRGTDDAPEIVAAKNQRR
jgi:hypothetical protein